MKTWLSLPTRLLKKPYDRVFPLILLAVVLGLTCASVRMLVVMPRQDEVSRLQAEEAAGTQRLAQLRQADRAAQEVKDVLNSLPGSRDFAKLPLAISEVAKRDRVTVPDLSYAVDKTERGVTKAVLKGPVIGKYEDLRRFIHHLESAERFLFIEDLRVARVVGKKAEKLEALTFTMNIGTYVREDQSRVPLEPRHP